MKFRKPKFSLAAKFSLFVPLPIVVASLALSSSFIKHDLMQIKAAMVEHGKAVARGLSYYSEYGLLVENKAALCGIIARHTNEKDLLYIVIRNTSEKILAGYSAELGNMSINTITNIPHVPKPEGGSECRVIETDFLYDAVCDVVTTRRRRNRKNLLQFDTPFDSAGEVKKIGTVQIGLSKSSMIVSMRQVKRDAVWVTVGAITLAILVTILVVGFMVRPIEKLAMAAGAVSRGDFDHPVKLSSRDEIRNLAESFNRMMANLKKSRDENEQYARELEIKTEELSRSNEELNAFVYTVSHDLKAPLVSLQGFSSLLTSNYGDCLDADGKMYVERIQKNTERMGTLIEDLLELSRVGRAKRQDEPVDVSEVISDVIDELAPKLEKQGTRLIMKDDMPIIYCDRTRVNQIFSNLISNASKYIGEYNENPTIEMGYDDGDDYYTFYVRDNGIGIDEKYHESVFGILQQLNEVEAEGTGMGLAIVKRIVDNFGGKIWIDSASGKGTTMYFTLPKTANIHDREEAE